MLWCTDMLLDVCMDAHGSHGRKGRWDGTTGCAGSFGRVSACVWTFRSEVCFFEYWAMGQHRCQIGRTPLQDVHLLRMAGRRAEYETHRRDLLVITTY